MFALSLLLFMGAMVLKLALQSPAAVSPVAALAGGDGLAFPGSSTAAYVAGGKAPSGGIPYTIVDATGDGLYRVVRFRAADSNDLVAELYLPPDQTGKVRLRPGFYHVHVAQGRRWRGPDVHFGIGGRVHDFGKHEVGGTEAGIRLAGATSIGGAPEIAGFRF